MNDDIEVHELEDGWLVLGAHLEAEARWAVVEDLTDRLSADPTEVGQAVIDLDLTDAVPGYWDLHDEDGTTEPYATQRFGLELEGAERGWLFRVED